MKKLTILLALSLFVGALNVYFAQDKMNDTKKTDKKKKKGKKVGGPPSQDKKM